MMETVRGWLLTLTAAACISSAALALTPEGAPKRWVKLVCGFVMLLALLSVVRGFDYDAFSLNLAKYRQEGEAIAGKAASDASDRTRFIIERQCEAYILGKARELGADVEVRVTAGWNEGGVWVPVTAELSGRVPDDVRLSLTRVIESELGIASARQKWSTDDEK